jgi:hypothetical protein
MLASTVQFSNNDQPPITPGYNRSALGPALKAADSAVPSDTQQRARHPCRFPHSFHAPKSSTGRRRQSSVPNNQRSTHEQPPSNVCRRNGPGPPGKPGSLDAP